MKFLLALILIIGLFSIACKSETHSANAATEAPSNNLPWFLTHFGDQNEFRLFIGETVLSIENSINPNASKLCVEQFINNTNTDYTQQGQSMVIPNITNFIRGITELAKKCGMQKIIDKVIIDLQYINANGLKTFIAKEVNSLSQNAQVISDCFRDVLIFSNNRNKQATQLELATCLETQSSNNNENVFIKKDQVYKDNTLYNIEDINKLSSPYLKDLTFDQYISIAKGFIKGLENYINPQNANICSNYLINQIDHTSAMFKNDVSNILISNNIQNSNTKDNNEMKNNNQETNTMNYKDNINSIIGDYYNDEKVRYILYQLKSFLINLKQLNNNICNENLIFEKIQFYIKIIRNYGIEYLIDREKGYYENNKYLFSGYVNKMIINLFFGSYENIGFNLGCCVGIYITTPYA